MKRHHRTHRARQRGAALVEAAVVIPVMLVFLGCIMFVYDSYNAKIQRQFYTRATIFAHASHACQGTPPPEITGELDDASAGTRDAPGEPPRIDPRRLEGSGTGVAQSLERTYLMVHAHPPDMPVYGSAVLDRQRVPLNRMVETESEVGCNENVNDGFWGSLGGFIKSVALNKGF